MTGVFKYICKTKRSVVFDLWDILIVSHQSLISANEAVRVDLLIACHLYGCERDNEVWIILLWAENETVVSTQLSIIFWREKTFQLEFKVHKT